MITVCLKADYGASPLWVLNEGVDTNVPLTRFHLTSAVKADLASWAGMFDALKRSNYEWPSDELMGSWIAEGSRLAGEVQRQLGSEYVVRYDQ